MTFTRLRLRTSVFTFLLLSLLVFLGSANAQTHSHPNAPTPGASGTPAWVGSWAASQQLVEPRNSLPQEDLQPPQRADTGRVGDRGESGATLRQVVHLTIGGAELRVHVSNRYGTAPLRITSLHVAKPAAAAASTGKSAGATQEANTGGGAGATSARIDPASDKAVTFSGRADVIIPAGADFISDPVAFPVAALADLVITLHLDQAPEPPQPANNGRSGDPAQQQTGHPGSRATSYVVHGNHVSAADLPDAKKVEHWYFIAGVDVPAPSSAQAAAVVVLGDSITDGHGATTDGNNRWPDVLARRLQAGAATRSVAVLNHGIGGNRLLTDGLGPSALARFDHDVLAQAGVRYLMVLEGVNDIGMFTRNGEVTKEEHDALVSRILTAYEQIITRAHAHDIRVIGATILPFTGSQFYHPSPVTDGDRLAINQWIRTSGRFDAVVDFDKLMRDPEHPERLLPAFDSGDHLHPGPAGYAAMGEAVPLSLFVSAPRGTGSDSPSGAKAEISQQPTAGLEGLLHPVAGDGNSGTRATDLRMAITFDDLPAHAALPPGETRAGIAAKILSALKDAHVPGVYGFVNGQRLEQQPAGAAVLEAWRKAGYPLGNHGWSHMNLDQNTAEAFTSDIGRNEPLLKQWMRKEDWRWFRFPFLREGDSAAKRAAVRTWLAKQGYKIAGVTMSFGDYQWNEPYARCKAKGDATAIAQLEASYLAAADESIGYDRGLAHTLYGRDIPYVLLMHVGAFDAEMLPRLLSLYESRGFKFVTLKEAESDEFYRADMDLRLPPGPNNLEAATGERNGAVPHHVSPVPELDSLCR